MSTATVADKALAILRRDLLTAARYRSAFILSGAGGLAELAAFYYLAHAIGPSFRPEGLDYFSFLLVGTGFYTFLIMGIHSFLETVQNAQQTGTLEVLLTMPTPPSVLVALSAISAFLRNILQLVLYIGAGLLIFREGLPKPHALPLLLTFVLCLGIAVGIGMMAAALQVSIQRGSLVLWVLGSGAWLLTGTLFPVASLPTPMHVAAELIPITHALNAMRLALLQQANLAMLSREIAVLATFVVILLPSGLAMFSYAVRRARQEGTLSTY